MTCICQTIGAPKELRLCDDHHRYYFGDRRLDSVTSVIRTLLPPDFSQIPASKLEAARLRGIFVDTYLCEYLTDPKSVLPLKEVEEMVTPQFPVTEDREALAADTIQRIERVVNWWLKSNLKAASVQRSVFSEEDGVAGTMDIDTYEGILIDIKTVAAVQPQYGLQLGAYLDMDLDHDLHTGAILHVPKDKVRLVPYDAAVITKQWRAAIEFYKVAKQLGKVSADE